MPLRDFNCQTCKHTFEVLVTPSEEKGLQCPQCGGKILKRKISLFAVKGRGDLRESTWHGCHGTHDPHQEEHAGHDHSDEHSSSQENVESLDSKSPPKTGTED